MIEWLKIITLCVGAAVVYGVLHDQITARVCVEYFTIGHPPVFNTDSPTLLALGWGVIATWWMGLGLSVPAIVAARIGGLPKLSARDLVRPIACLLGVMALAALVCGVSGYSLAKHGPLVLLPPLDNEIPRPKHAAFLADAFAHSASYAVGFFGGLAVCALMLRKRWQRAKQPS